MNHQFKFGDIVLHKETGKTGSVIDFKSGVVANPPSNAPTARATKPLGTVWPSP